MSSIKVHILGLCLIIAAFGAGYYWTPAKIVTRDVITTITEKPDGSKETIIKEVEKTVTKPEEKKNWLVSAQVPINDLRFDNSQIIISVQKRIIGELYAGPWASLDGTFGLGISFRF